MTPYTLHHGDCLDILRTFPDASVDAVITDPPYGYGIDHWDCSVDISALTGAVRRVLRPGGFYSFFGQMPTIADWHQAAMLVRFHFCEDITWVKRIATPMHRLNRGHEHIFVYAAGQRKAFFCTHGPYEDVKLPGIMVDVVTLEGIDRHIKDLRRKIEGHPTTHSRGATGITSPRKFSPNRVGDRSPATANYTNVWSFLSPNAACRNGEYRHPTEKPTEIMKRLVEMLTPPHGLVLDPFMGSGTTGHACLNLGRHFIGIERDAGYFALAEQRLADATMQQRLPLDGVV